jgi:hypothetical protein
MTATVSWLFLDAIAGAVPDVSKQTLYLNPQLLPGEQTLRTPVFLTTSWFMLEYQVEADKIKMSIKPLRQFALFPVAKLILGLPVDLLVKSISINGVNVDCASTGDSLTLPVSFDPGIDCLAISVN